MKRILTILMAILLMFSLFSVSASAYSDSTETTLLSDREYREQRFVEMLNEMGYSQNPWEDENTGWYIYQEIYTPKTSELILAEGRYYAEAPGECYGVFDDIVVLSGNYYSPFPLDYYVYDEQADSFSYLGEAWAEKEPEFKQEIRDFFLSSGIARLIGDCDQDHMISILDATYIQKAIANIHAFDDKDALPEINVYGEKLNYISDYDRDGVRSVLDASHIQKHLAGLE